MILLCDIGNTHTHLGLASRGSVTRHWDVPTADWFSGRGAAALKRLLKNKTVTGASVCSVVPKATPRLTAVIRQGWEVTPLVLTAANTRGVGIRYPRPGTIGPDRLANAIAANQLFGPPAVVVDFGTAVTFDVLDRRGDYVGGIIAPGLSVMTDYLHEKTALLPRIKIRDTAKVVGKNTREAMLIGAVHGYRGLVRGLLAELRRELGAPRLRVIATGGYARLMAAGLPEITDVAPELTLEGLRLLWLAHQHADGRPGKF